MLNRDDLVRKFKEKFRTALVTGAAGFIGSHIVEELLNMDIIVLAVDDYSAGKMSNLEIFMPNKNLKIIDSDVSNLADLEKYFENVDVVFHNAASKKNICLKDPARDLEVNAKGALNIMLLSKKYGVKKVVHASTGSVYGEPTVFPVTEEHPINPTSYYGVSKLAGERYVDVFNKLHDVDTTILRYFHVYGSRQETDPYLGGVVAIFINNILNKYSLVVHGDGNQIRSFTYVKDIVNANLIVAILPEAKNQIYNCASGVKISINQLSKRLLELFETSENFKVNHESELIGDIRYFDIDNSKIRSLGLEFTSFEEGLISTISSYKNLEAK